MGSVGMLEICMFSESFGLEKMWDEKSNITKRSIDKLILEQVNTPSPLYRSLATDFTGDGFGEGKAQGCFSQGVVICQ